MKSYRIGYSIRRNFFDYGLLPTLIKLFRRLIAPVYENYTYRIYCIDLDLKKQIKCEPNRSITLGLVTFDDVGVIWQIEQLAEWFSNEIRDKLSSNYICVVALDGRKLAGFNLICLNQASIPLLKLKWELAADEAWSEQITVDRAYRRKGLGLALRNKAFDELRQLGIKRFVGGALRSNEQSLRLAERAGYRFTEDIQYIKTFWKKKWIRHEVLK